MFIIFLVFFATLTGGSSSVVRAVIMSILMLIASLIHRKSDTLNNIAISALIILLNNPYEIFNLGFQLSFLGTLGIVLFHSKINFKLINLCSSTTMLWLTKMTKNKRFKDIVKIISVSISANILIMPILIYNFNTFSLVFIVSNLLVTPILAILIFSGYISVFISLISINISIFPASIFNCIINIFYKIAEISSNIKFLRFVVGTPKVGEVILIYGCFWGYFLTVSQKLYSKLLVIILICSIIFGHFTFCNRKFTIHFIDVGQGDCTLIITSTNKTILIDGGGSESGDYDVGQKVLVPYLLDRRIKSIDYIVFSHFDSDHCQGLFSVMKELKVRNAIISEQSKISDNYKVFIKIAKEKRCKGCKSKSWRQS